MNAKQRLAVQLKARGLSDAEIARRLKVSKMTLLRWWQDSEVQKALNDEMNAVSAKVSEKLDNAFLSYDDALSKEALDSLNRVREWILFCYSQARTDPESATKWLAIAFRGEALVQSAYLRRFAKVVESSESTMKSIVDEAIRLMMSGELDDTTDIVEVEDTALEAEHHQVRRRSAVGAEPENGTASTFDPV